MLALIFEPVFANEDGVAVSAPLAHQCRACPQHDTGMGGPAALLELSGQRLQATPLRPARAAMGFLLQPVSKGSDQQIAAEARRRFRAVDLTPSQPQILCRSIDQSDNVDFELGDVRTAGLIFPITTATGNGRGPEFWRAEALWNEGFIRLPVR